MASTPDPSQFASDGSRVPVTTAGALNNNPTPGPQSDDATAGGAPAPAVPSGDQTTDPVLVPPAGGKGPVSDIPTTTEPTAGGGGVNLGLAIGVPIAILFVIFLIVLFILFWRRWRARKQGGMDLEQAEARNGKIPIDGIIREKKISHILLHPPSREGAELYVVRHFYKAEDDNQLSLQTGRFVEVLEKMDNGWWRGTTDDKEGWFPAEFVKKIDVADSLVIEDVDAESGPKRSTNRNSESYEEWVKHTAPNGKIENVNQENIQGYLNEIFTIGDESDGSKHSTADRKTMGLFESKMVEEKEETIVTDSDFTDQEQRIDFCSDEDTGELPGRADPVASSIAENTVHAQRSATAEKPNLGTDGNNAANADTVNCVIVNSLGAARAHQGESSARPPHSTQPVPKPDDQSTPTLPTSSSLDKSETHNLHTLTVEPHTDAVTAEDAVVHRPGASVCGAVMSDTPGSPVSQAGARKDPDQSDVLSLVTLLSTTDDTFDSDADDDSRVEQPKMVVGNDASDDTRSKVFVAMYPFQPSSGDQIRLSPNDVILVEGVADTNGWIQGQKRDSGEKGWFPKSYVREGKSPPTSRKTAPNGDGEIEDVLTGMEHRAVYSYAPQQEGDLTLEIGDAVVVLEMLDNGWWRGCKGDQEGWFPGSYVEGIPQTPATPQARAGAKLQDAQTPALAASSPTHQASTELALDVSPIPTSTKDMQQAEGSSSATKPHVPKRFVVPRLVKLHPKRLSRISKWVKRPNRPAPPAPKSPAACEVVPANNKPAAQGKAKQLKKRKFSVDRPKVPPPRPPSAPTGRRASDGNAAGRRPPLNRAMSEGYSNVVPSWDSPDGKTVFSVVPISDNLDDRANVVKPSDTAKVSDTNLVAVENGTNAKLDSSKKNPPARPVMPVAPLALHKGSKTPPPMRLFKNDSQQEQGVSESKLSLSYSGAGTLEDKRTPPPLPPKPDPLRLRFRRSKSDPNVMAIKSLALARPPSEKYENVNVFGLNPVLEGGVGNKEDGKVPPDRPKDPPKHNLSSGSLKAETGELDEVFQSDFKMDVSFGEKDINEILLSPVWTPDPTTDITVEFSDDKEPEPEPSDFSKDSDKGQPDTEEHTTYNTRTIPSVPTQTQPDEKVDSQGSEVDIPSQFSPRPVTPPKTVSPVKRAKSPHRRRPRSFSPVPNTRDSGNGSLPTSPLTVLTFGAATPDVAGRYDEHNRLQAADDAAGQSRGYTTIQSPSETSLVGRDAGVIVGDRDALPQLKRDEYSQGKPGTEPPPVSDQGSVFPLRISSVDSVSPNDQPSKHSYLLHSPSPIVSPANSSGENRHLRFYTPAKFVSKYSPTSMEATSPTRQEPVVSPPKRVISPVPAVGSEGTFISRVKVDFSTPRPYFRPASNQYSTQLSNEELVPPVRKDYSSDNSIPQVEVTTRQEPFPTTISAPGGHPIKITKTRFSTSPLHDLDDMDLESEV